MLPDILLDRAVAMIPVILSLTVHEWAHAWTAWKLGDDTARLLGRVSLNPIDHIDPIGTLLLPMLGIPFGWAKPVPFNPTQFRPGVSMSMGTLLVAAAGPISNLLLAAIGCVLLIVAQRYSTTGVPGPVQLFLVTIVMINVLLALFNLIPIPPLDGSRIVESIVPDSLRPLWNHVAALGPFLLVGVIVLPSVLFHVSVMSVPMQWVSNGLGQLLGNW